MNGWALKLGFHRVACQRNPDVGENAVVLCAAIMVGCWHGLGSVETLLSAGLPAGLVAFGFCSFSDLGWSYEVCLLSVRDHCWGWGSRSELKCCPDSLFAIYSL